MSNPSIKKLFKTTKPVLGIISGAGPLAGLAFQKSIIKAFQNAGASRDFQYPHYL